MINPNEPTHLQRLRRAMRQSYKDLELFRDARTSAVRQFCGRGYGEGTTESVPINTVELLVGLIVRTLAARNPGLLIKTKDTRLELTREKLEAAGAQLLDEINFAESVSRFVTDACFCIGIMKVGWNVTDRGPGFLHKRGQPFADPIDFENVIFDTSARTWEAMSFIGDKYRLPLSVVRETEEYDKDLREAVQPSSKYTRDSDFVESDSIYDLSRGTVMDPDEYEPHVELIDIWLPREQLLLTVPTEKDEKVLRVVEWDGPSYGPYHKLGFTDVPGQIVPLAPIVTNLDLHHAINILYNKVIDQGDRQKNVGVISGQAKEDGKRIMEAKDGDVVLSNNPSAAKEVKIGGPDQVVLALAMHLYDRWNRQAGNPEVAAGQASGADTLGQEQMLLAQSSKKLGDYHEQAVKSIRRIVEHLMFYDYYDPTMNRRLELTLKPSGVKYKSVFTPAERESNFLSYKIEIVPYSMQQTSPQMEMAKLSRFWMTFVQPNLQFIAQRASINWEAMLQDLAKLDNIQGNITRWIDFGKVQAPPPPDSRPTPPPSQPKQDMRINTSGNMGSREGRDAATQQALLSGSTISAGAA